MVTDQVLSEIAAGHGEKLTQLSRRVLSYRSGRPATLSRLLRWILTGVKGPGGETVRLEGVKTPGGWISTPAALTRFFAALTPGTPVVANTSRRGNSRSDQQRQRAAELAGRKLEELGI